ncbi:MAG: MerR family transcriptional regulator, partial [Firmicutes bacterium]|nr:MerR family transcriptional regulator [Bacillota bacterium]
MQEIPMKIGELTKAYGVSNQTIRYYVKMGLLIPETKEKQYVFNEQSREDLELILKLKQF